MRAGNKDQMLILEIISRMQELQVSSLCSARTRAVDWRTQHRTGLIWLQVHHVSLTIPSPPPYLLPGTGFLPNLSSQHNLSSEHKSGNQCNISGWRRWQSLPVFLLSRTPVTPDTPYPPQAHPSDHTTVTSSSGTSWRTSTSPPLTPWSLPYTRSVCLVSCNESNHEPSNLGPASEEFHSVATSPWFWWFSRDKRGIMERI